MKVSRCIVAALASLLPGSLALQDDEATNPISKVVGLLNQMKATVEKDAKEDDEAYDKFACWCQTNKQAKTEAVATATKRIAELEAFVEEAFGLQAQYKNEISALEADIAQNQDSLSKAAAVRASDAKAYEAASKDSKSSIAGLREALSVLSKVQLMQQDGHKLDSAQVRPLLLQLRGVVRDVHGHLGQFRSVMQQDLWAVMGSLDQAVGGSTGSFLPRLSMVGRQGVVSHQPASYNAQSGQIVGILSTLNEEFEKGLAAAQRQELDALISYHKLRSTKVEQVSAAISQKKAKEQALDDIQAQAAQAKEELSATKAALLADQDFLAQLGSSCQANDEEHAARQQSRKEEIQAIGDVIKMLTEDDVRDLFSKTMSFMQLGSVVQGAGKRSVAISAADAAQRKMAARAMQHLLKTARKNKDWMLASLAVRVQLDAFTKVKEVIDKMVVDLKEQQKAEYEKKETCNKQIDETEDSIKVKESQKEDLEAAKLNYENTIATIEADLQNLQAEVANMKVNLKRAGEDRKAQNLAFQRAVSDQRLAVNVLKKAQERLQQFYSSPEFAQLVAKRHGAAQVPGAPVAPPPPKAQDYQHNGMSGGVLQILAKIIGDAEKEEVQMVAEEQHAQADYAALTNAATQTITANEAAILEKTKLVQQATAEKSETQASLLANSEELNKLTSMLSAMHSDCDWLLKYFNARQTARQEEIESIQEAKAILSGANFGKDDQ